MHRAAIVDKKNIRGIVVVVLELYILLKRRYGKYTKKALDSNSNRPLIRYRLSWQLSRAITFTTPRILCLLRLSAGACDTLLLRRYFCSAHEYNTVLS